MWNNLINKNIHELRTQQGLTLQELADKVGTSKQTIQRYESGEISNIPYNKIMKLASALNTTPSKLMGLDDLLPFEDELEIDIIYKSLPTDAQERLLAYAKKLKELLDMEK
jgi:transcriptional regulator with XRE-family HTH domain